MRRRKRVNVYVSATRPAHDSAPTQSAELTDAERRTLVDLIGRYMVKCRQRAERDDQKRTALDRARAALA